jgi:hypothetical protein
MINSHLGFHCAGNMGKSKCNSNDRMKEEEERFIEMLKVFNLLSHTHIYRAP